MSGRVHAVPAGIEAFAATSATLGTATAGAAVGDTARAAVMAAAFGLIGQEFLAAYGVAEANHLAAVARLAAVHGGTASATTAGLAALSAADTAGASGLEA
ncbi:hypothetical protein [Gordonia humi]|uniref:Excreted virulence factor EspC, type VII ESX diderm n=1 Tax=Gordonia humi TaxID=686429 RepID=A0A840FDX4_9ACTN|nr:hypothetical protein [Gordonia humi]MBB4137647.1 hypothetical protein [Gordonia humi]